MCVQADDNIPAGRRARRIESGRYRTASILLHLHFKVGMSCLECSYGLSRSILRKPISDDDFHLPARIGLLQHGVQQQSNGRHFIVTWDDDGYGWRHSKVGVPWVSGVGLGLPDKGQVHHEAGPEPLCTSDADFTTVGSEYILGNGQSQTSAVLLTASSSRVGSITAAEDMGNGDRRNAVARIVHGDLGLTSVLHGPELDLSPARRELQRIIRQLA